MSVKEKLTALADSIRAKTGMTDLLTLDQMATTISELKTGGVNEPYIEEEYNSNGNLINAHLYGHMSIRPYLFSNCTKLTLASLPSDITSIGDYAFQNCSNLPLTSLPSDITSIGKYAFQNCSKLTLASLPSGITSIGDYAFQNCLNLKSITFEGTPTSIGSNTFQGCYSLTTINVPWAEGKVANAPWGATKATINYNYTGE